MEKAESLVDQIQEVQEGTERGLPGQEGPETPGTGLHFFPSFIPSHAILRDPSSHSPVGQHFFLYMEASSVDYPLALSEFSVLHFSLSAL